MYHFQKYIARQYILKKRGIDKKTNLGTNSDAFIASVVVLNPPLQMVFMCK